MDGWLVGWSVGWLVGGLVGGFGSDQAGSRVLTQSVNTSRFCSGWSGLVWLGLVWSGLVRFGLVWSGLVWFGGSVWFGGWHNVFCFLLFVLNVRVGKVSLARSGPTWPGLAQPGPVWPNLARSGPTWPNLVGTPKVLDVQMCRLCANSHDRLIGPVEKNLPVWDYPTYRNSRAQ